MKPHYPGQIPPLFRPGWWHVGVRGLQGAIAFYLLLFFLLPVCFLFLKGLQNPDGSIGWGAMELFSANPIFLESLRNSLLVGIGAAVLAGVVALAVAALLWKNKTRPSPFMELCGFLPLFLPAFVLASSLDIVFGQHGGLPVTLQSWFGMSRMGASLLSLVLIEAVHYFPFILVALHLTTRASSSQAHTLARLGTPWRRLIARVFVPLALPGLAFAMALTFLKVIDDLATPLALGLTNMLAPQAYHRIADYGAKDPLAALIAGLLFLTSGFAWFTSLGFIRQKVSFFPAGPEASRQPLSGGSLPGRMFVLILGTIYLGCYTGLILSSLAGVWSHSAFPESYVLTHYLKALQFEMSSVYNTLIYCGLAALIDIVVALPLAHAIAKASPRWKQRLGWLVAGTLCIPGVTLGIAYLAFFRDIQLPMGALSLDTTGFLLTLAFSIRGLPFALHICSLALNSIPSSHIEAAHTLGSAPLKIAGRIVFPMLRFALLLAFTLCFSLAAVDISLAAFLVPNENSAPLAYSIYLHLQSPSGMNVGSALAVISFALLALILLGVIHRLHRRDGSHRPLVPTLFSTPPSAGFAHEPSHH